MHSCFYFKDALTAGQVKKNKTLNNRRRYEDVRIAHDLGSKLQKILLLLQWKKITVIYDKENGIFKMYL